MIVDSPALTAVATSQDGLVCLAQVHEAGFSFRDVRSMLDTGRWRQPLPRVFLTSAAEISLEQKRTAAGLYTAGLGQLSGLAALAWHGISGLPDHRTILMLIPHTMRRASHDFVHPQRTRRPDQGAKDAGTYQVCSIPRATADACRYLSDKEVVTELVAMMIGRGWTTAGDLRRELEAAGASRTRALRVALREFG